jgi:outer membrane protein assembly factor BamE (lipoprotein component of BamABCDE complex)
MIRPLRRVAAAAAVMAAAALAAGCAGPQTPQPGATQAEVEAQLGRPRATFPLPDGGRQVEFNYVRGATTYIVFFNGAGKVVEAVQALNEANFRQVRPGMSQEQVLRLIGHPFRSSPGGRRAGQIWDYPFQNTQCQQFQVQFTQGDAQVASAGFTLLPHCMNAPS